MQASDLPPKSRLTLARPDLSAKEAVAFITAHAGDAIRRLQAFSVTIAGAADAGGRLATGAWDVCFLTLEPDQFIHARLFENGTLSFALQSMRDRPPPAFDLEGDWIDSTLAARAIENEPLPPSMGEHHSLFLSLRSVTDSGLFWEVRRIYGEPAKGLQVTQSFGIDASSGDIAVEAIEIQEAGVVVESRYRRPLEGGKWIDRRPAPRQ